MVVGTAAGPIVLVGRPVGRGLYGAVVVGRVGDGLGGGLLVVRVGAAGRAGIPPAEVRVGGAGRAGIPPAEVRVGGAGRAGIPVERRAGIPGCMGGRGGSAISFLPSRG